MRLWGGRFSGETGHADGRLHALDRGRPCPRARRPGGLGRPRPRPRAGRAARRRPRSRPWSRASTGCAGEVEAGTLAWDPALEDVHLNLEAALAARIGPLAGKLHTGRSRNDQVATDLRLWMRRTIDGLDEAVVGLERALVGLAEREGDGDPSRHDPHPAGPARAPRPPPARLRRDARARPRPARRLPAAARTSSPLGSGALAGAGYPLDREATARELGFDGVTANSLDAVSDRDFVAEFLAAAALAMVHLSRLAEEITWWSNPRFGFVAGRRRVLDRQLDDAEQEEPGSRRARPRSCRPRDRPPGRAAGAAQGPAARLPARPPGGQAAALRGCRDARGARSA